MRWRTKKKTGKKKPTLRPYMPPEDAPDGERPAAASGSRSSSPNPPNRRAPDPDVPGNSQGRERKAKLSRLSRPAGMSLEDWQIELRRQFGREQDFRLTNVGEQPIFSEFDVLNPQSQGTYRVHIRGHRPGDNYCACPDFATNTLGTCKHIEFTLAALERKRGGKEALRDGFQPEYSEIYLHYGTQREVRFRPGTGCPKEMARLAERYFGPDGALLPDAFGRFDTFLQELGSIDHEVRYQEDVLSFIAEVRDAERRRQLVAEMFPRGAA